MSVCRSESSPQEAVLSLENIRILRQHYERVKVQAQGSLEILQQVCPHTNAKEVAISGSTLFYTADCPDCGKESGALLRKL